ncbi:transcriptional regulator with XRE-family HTH domain [Kribbella italica]|uniref:Transcriptional regulator with XRE-family HTH domain n=1 Tax=Kribbella italica TaxID=1540520 RepID=A0A7W9MXR1_9ACTN|nr:transcriptional regulator with XRE-family HTH domain [Kribbella italica]
MPDNNTADATNVHEARTALGKRLRELRRSTGSTGREFAESLAWAPSKVSKLENGRQTPSDEDLRAWARASDHQSELDALLASLHSLELQFAEWRHLMRAGLRPQQEQLYEWDQKTRLLRVFEATVVPGLLQTGEYARARFEESVRRLKITNDAEEAVAARLRRQEILYRPGKQFHFVLTEAALRFRLCPLDAMLGQLDRLASISHLRNVKVGIIATETAYTVSPWHGFWIYDDRRVLLETFSAELDLRQPQEIELYADAFEQLAGVASYDRDARKIIGRVMADLASESDVSSG